VNQDGLAAWSAVLSGVVALTNQNPTPGKSSPEINPGWRVIQPAGIYDPAVPSPVAQIVEGINRTRANTNPNLGPVFAGHVFHQLGDILNVPELSVGMNHPGTFSRAFWKTNASPFLSPGDTSDSRDDSGIPNKEAWGISEEAYERIPQQIMGLLTLSQTPRFVIYSFGQTLRPAENSVVVAGGPFNKLCTNYQVTAEVATRAVVRIEGTPDPRYTNGYPDTHGQVYPPHIVVEQFNVLPPD
jgi:hypothetical protein